jgi:hypothetical protein
LVDCAVAVIACALDNTMFWSMSAMGFRFLSKEGLQS